MRSRTAEASPARVAALWFGVQLAWGAILGIALQARCAQLGGTNALALFAWVATSGAIAAALTQLVVGPWSDRVRARTGGRGAFFAAGVVAGSLAIPAFFLASGAALLVAAFVLLQVALNVAIGPYQAIVPDTIARARIGEASAWVAGMQSAGNAAGAVLATLLGATPLLGAVLAFALLASSAVTLAHLRGRGALAAGEPQSFRLQRAFADLFISRALVYLGFYTLLGYLYFFVASRLPPHFPLDATRASGIAVLLFTLVGTGGAALAARPADRIDERAVVSTGGAILAVALIALCLTRGAWPFALAVTAAGIGWGIFLAADWALACRVLPVHSMATAMAIWNLAILLPQILAPPLASAFLALGSRARLSPDPALAIALSAGEILAGTLWIWRVRATAMRPQAAPP